MATKITREILEAYLNCKVKAHLKLGGYEGIRSDYEGLLAETRQDVRRTAIGKILARQAESDVPSKHHVDCLLPAERSAISDRRHS